jgi:hypothetical protein
MKANAFCGAAALVIRLTHFFVSKLLEERVDK